MTRDAKPQHPGTERCTLCGQWGHLKHANINNADHRLCWECFQGWLGMKGRADQADGPGKLQ